MTDVRFVYFDLDDTLLDHRQAERAALRETCSTFPALAGIAFEEVHAAYHLHNSDLWVAFSNGEIIRDDLKRLRFERTLAHLGADTALTDDANRHYMACYARHWHLRADARTAFAHIASHFPVGILTNGFADVQHAKLERFPELREPLSTLVISEEVGVMKPHRAIFDFSARQAGVDPQHILYVGDSLRSDVLGALGAGWQAAWFGGEATDAPGGVFAFHDWAALMAILQ